MSDTPRILFADHRGAGLAARAEAWRRSGGAAELTTTVRDTLAALSAPFEAFVLDPWLEGGAEELAALAERVGAGFPGLVLADPLDPSAAVAALRGRASPYLDVLRRDAREAEFALRLERLLALAEERRRVVALEHRAAHDDRTDLLRPDAFQQRLSEHFSAAQRHHFELALLILDLDGFGKINKQWDHTVGDHVIEKVGEAIRKNLRQEDVAGRLGGDEFAVLLPYTGRLEAAHAVRRLRDAIARLSPLLSARTSGLTVSTSIGFETYDGTDLDGADTLRLHAEAALHAAKAMGGGQAVYYRSLAARGAE
ncbi:MAG: GGDEF domain-containing protein [Planctomycetes bacterium]|nr:GGDEF domain-containing protein [Planctomycetota bacterium]